MKSMNRAQRRDQLTATEFKVLRVLSVDAGRVVTYDSLLRQAWGWAGSGLRRPEAGAGGQTALRRLRRNPTWS